MKGDLELARGSGNLFRDLGAANADAEQLKSVLAAQIVKLLDARKLTVRAAATMTGMAAADFSRIRNVKLDRFTIDRLMMILARLGQKVDVRVSVRQRRPTARRTPKAA